MRPSSIKARIEPTLVQQLTELPVWARSIVAHPDALSDVGVFRPLGTRLVLENMDDRKNTGRTADEIEAFFEELPDAGFCLDVAHAWSWIQRWSWLTTSSIAAALGSVTCTSAHSAMGPRTGNP